MLGAVNTGSGEGAVTGRSSRRRILRWPAAWWRCGIVFTRNLLGAWAVGSVTVDPMCRKLREISNFSLSNRTIHISDHAWLRLSYLVFMWILFPAKDPRRIGREMPTKDEFARRVKELNQK